MLKWEQEIINSKDLVLINPEDLDWKKFDSLFNRVIDRYKVHHTEISKPMINGLNKFYSDCKKSLEKKVKMVIKYKVYCRMLRWIVTKNPRYLSVNFDEFREAMKGLWKFLFGECFHEFRYPTEKKTYIDDKEVWLEWFECIEGKLKE